MDIRCGGCQAPLIRASYEVRSGGGSLVRCFWCAVRQWPLVRRSLIIALIVGTALTAINQGNVIVAGDFPTQLAWKIPLTYSVPYCVSTAGAILNARRPRASVSRE